MNDASADFDLPTESLGLEHRTGCLSSGSRRPRPFNLV